MSTAVDTDFAASTSKSDGKKSSNRIQCVVVTPERTIFDELVESVVLPLFDGELGVLPGRAPLIGRLGFGELRTNGQGSTKRYFIDGGFAQVRDNVVTILTNRAIPAVMIDVQTASKELEAFKARKATTATDLDDRMRAIQRATRDDPGGRKKIAVSDQLSARKDHEIGSNSSLFWLNAER